MIAPVVRLVTAQPSAGAERALGSLSVTARGELVVRLNGRAELLLDLSKPFGPALEAAVRAAAREGLGAVAPAAPAPTRSPGEIVRSWVSYARRQPLPPGRVL